MSFYLNDSYITDSYLRQQLLNNDKPSSALEEFDNGVTDDINYLLDNEPKRVFFEKLNVKPDHLTSEELLNFMTSKITEHNIDLYSALLTMNKTHLLAILYLMYEGRIVEYDLERIVKSSTVRGRTEIILSYLTKTYKEGYIDIFLPLKKEIAKMVNIVNPTEIHITELQALRKDLKNNKKLNVKKQYLSKGNFYYAEKGINSPLNLCYKDDIIIAADSETESILKHNTFDLRDYTLGSENYPDAQTSYSNYVLKTGNGSLTFTDYEKDIKIGKELKDFLENSIPDTYKDTFVNFPLNEIFAKVLVETCLELVEIDYENRNNPYFSKSKYPNLSYFIDKILKETYKAVFDNNYSGEKTISNKTYKYSDILSNFIQVENSLNPGHYLFNMKNEKKIDDLLKMDVLVDENNKLINFGSYNILKDMNKLFEQFEKSFEGKYGNITNMENLMNIEFNDLEELLPNTNANDYASQIIRKYFDYLFNDENGDDDITSVFILNEINNYESTFKLRHFIIRFNDALLRIKNNPIYIKIMNDPCNCNELFSEMASMAKYLEYNEYFQKNINNEGFKFTAANVNSFKPGMEGFGGIL